MKAIYISQLYNLDTSKLYLDIAFLTVKKSQKRDAINKNYFSIVSLDDRYFIGDPGRITKTFDYTTLINHWNEPFLKDRPFNYLYLYDNDLYVGNIFPILFK